MLNMKLIDKDALVAMIKSRMATNMHENPLTASAYVEDEDIRRKLKRSNMTKFESTLNGFVSGLLEMQEGEDMNIYVSIWKKRLLESAYRDIEDKIKSQIKEYEDSDNKYHVHSNSIEIYTLKSILELIDKYK